jgi:DDE superfamily endonuclease/Transposase
LTNNKNKKAAATSSDKSRVRYSNAEKIAILDWIDSEPGLSLTSIAQSSGIKYHTLKAWVRQRHKLRDTVQIPLNVKAKANPERPLWRVEQAMLQWFQYNDRALPHKKIPISISVLTETAQIAKDKILERHESIPFLDDKELKSLREFTCSESWAKKVARIYKWSLTDIPKAGNLQYLHEIVSKYPADCVFFATDMTLFYKLLPNRSYIVEQDGQFVREPDAMQDKNRLTVYACVNESGTCKVPLVAVGQTANPPVFARLPPPFPYTSQTRAWADHKTFSFWLDHFYEYISSVTTQKVLLLINSTLTHGASLVDESGQVLVLALPSDYTTVYPFPIYTGLVQTMTRNYRFAYLRKIMQWYSEYKLLRVMAKRAKMRQGTMGLAQGHVPHVVDAMEMLKDIWEGFSRDDMQKWWRKCAIRPADDFDDDDAFIEFENDCANGGGNSASDIVAKQVDETRMFTADLAQFVATKYKDACTVKKGPSDNFGSTADELDNNIKYMIEVLLDEYNTGGFKTSTEIYRVIDEWVKMEESNDFKEWEQHESNKTFDLEMLLGLKKTRIDDTDNEEGSETADTDDKEIPMLEEEIRQSVETILSLSSRCSRAGVDYKEVAVMLQNSANVMLEVMNKVHGSKKQGRKMKKGSKDAIKAFFGDIG